MHKQEYMSLEKLCDILSISVATGRNWLKTGRLTSQATIDGRKCFTEEYVNGYKNNLLKKECRALKTRRNKKYVTGNALYADYVSDASVNIRNVRKLLETVNECGVVQRDELTALLVAQCAMQLMTQRCPDRVTYAGEPVEETALFGEYLDGKVSFGVYDRLLDELISDKIYASELFAEYHDIFKQTYTYEEGEDILGLIYISVRKMWRRKASGAYYTPTKLVKKLIDKLALCNDGSTILDPCCGTGNFLLQLPDTVDISNIYAMDIDSLAVRLTRINLALKYRLGDVEILYRNIVAGNFLMEDSDEDYSDENYSDEGERYSNKRFFNRKYDYIIGNPPWGYDFNETELRYMKKHYRTSVGGKVESAAVFTEKALNMLKDNGTMSFVLPESMLTVGAHKPIREYITDICSVRYIAYLGEAFYKVQCPSVILTLEKTGKPINTIGTEVEDGARSFVMKIDHKIYFNEFDFRMNDEEFLLLEKIRAVKNVKTLRDNASFALGIVTGNNEDIIEHEKTDENEPVIRGINVQKYNIDDTDNFIEFHPERLQQVAKTELYRAPEKLVYRFIGKNLVFAYDDRQRLTLNSCNIVIPRIKNMEMKYILAVLNSGVVQFYWRKVFNSLKVLRSHLEMLPIPEADAEKQREIVELVDDIMKKKERSLECEDVYRRLDKKIAILYGLADGEYEDMLKSIDFLS